MKFTAAYTLLLLAFAPSLSAQTTYLQLGQEDYHLFDRLETRSGSLSPYLFNFVKPLSRKNAVRFLLEQKDDNGGVMLYNNVDQEADAPSRFMISHKELSGIDRYNIDHAISISGEWAPDRNGAIDSRRPIFNTFYKKQPDLLNINVPDFFLSVNPVITFQGLHENNTADNFNYASSRGAEVRGIVANRIGFYTYFADNQEQPPSFIKDYIEKNEAVPGADYYQTPNARTYDYLTARGYIDFAAIRDHINVTFGYDKHFLGDGVRSLFLSDFSAPTTFLRLNTRVWKLNYQNLFMELTPQYDRGADQRLPHKYATMHHLSANVTRWLNIGVFESIIFDRTDRYEFSYAVPIIFYRQVERALGSPDNALLGLNFKTIFARHFQVYGQLLLDEFKLKELTAGNGWWGNKLGVQLGGKYFDAFGIKNLDLQGELNIVRPFTYGHNDTIANYTHYNQPLAHPLGAGFKEFIGIIKYQPVRNLYLQVKGMAYSRGVDTGVNTQGNNIFTTNTSRAGEYGYDLISGVKANAVSVNFNASYELRENLFLDLGATVRRYQTDYAVPVANNTTYFYGGFRLNLARRDYDFY